MGLKGRLRNVSKNEGCQDQAGGAWQCGTWPRPWKATPDAFSATRPEILLKNGAGVMPTATAVLSLLLPLTGYLLRPCTFEGLTQDRFLYLLRALSLLFTWEYLYCVFRPLRKIWIAERKKMKITGILPPTEKHLTFWYVSFQTCVYVCIFTEMGYTQDSGIAFLS